MGRSKRKAISSRPEVLLVHLLKLQYQPERAKGGWEAIVREQRRALRRLLLSNPGLVNFATIEVGLCYPGAVAVTAGETGLLASVFPRDCPFTLEDLLIAVPQDDA